MNMHEMCHANATCPPAMNFRNSCDFDGSIRITKLQPQGGMT